jgi:4-amino-4-deoxy-L-arabinose transferase-like glycosyltransferase
MAPMTANHATVGQRSPVSNKQYWLISGVLLGCLWLGGLGQVALFDVDEGAFAQASREMVASGDWGHTTLNGTDRFDKPILVYWLQAASLKVFGITEFAVRLPSALCALGLALATAAFLRVRLGIRSAQVTPWLLASMIGPALIGRAATADALLGLLIALAAFDLWRCLEPEAPADAQRAALRRAALWVGLGLLTKGPVALLIPGGSALLWVLAGPATDRGTLMRRMFCDPLAWAIPIVIAAPWYAYAWLRHGWAFIDGFLLRHNFERLVGPLEGHGGSFLYYVLVLPLVLLPWSALLLPTLVNLRRLWGIPLTRYLLGWAGFVVVFFSLAGTKLPHYVLYGVVPIAILFALSLSQGISGTVVAGVALGVVFLLAASLGSPGLAGMLAASGDPFWQARLSSTGGAWLTEPLPWLLGFGAMCLLVCVCILPRGRTPALVGAAVIAQLVWLFAALPWWSEHLQAPVRNLGQQAANADLALVQWRVHQPSVGFYLGGVAPRRAPQAGEAALARADRFDALPGQEREAYRVLAREGGFVLIQHR